MKIEGIGDQKPEKQTVKNKNHNKSDTTAIRISSDVYELIREKAFFERTTIRQVADDILKADLT